ncbi:hypothetical protein AVEN_151207-1 [Araneus ventricosus]|uniref:CCHC-type domain-containing protein n=1 Tax=Araneus ventricosus TaxID=182803 RepID=A0A4Y2WBH9_ARAVE|nr:hypothetical protein AVEN_151207-1 [Araneus ventricosus]
MSTLPPEYFEFKSEWESVPVQEKTINKLTERLRLIEMRLPGKQAEHSALVANTSVNKRTYKPKQEKAEKKCFRCHKPGHLAKKCYKKSSYSKRPEGDAFLCSEEVQDKDVWLADSGASAHMTTHKEYFL